MSSQSKKRSDIETVPERVKRQLDQLTPEERSKYEGFGGTKKVESIPEFIQADCEKVIRGENNSWIVLGRDRPAGVFSGHGGGGSSHAASIDLCVGRGGAHTKRTDENGTPLYINNDFKSDAARIYISQKTDIDRNFGIVPGIHGNPTNRSAIGIKADNVRVIARESIKLVTRTDDKNSRDGNINTTLGIQLIAGDDDSDMQPLVKGDNLMAVLDFILKDIESLTNVVHSMTLSQLAFDQILQAHTHPTTTGIAFPSPEVLIAGSAKSIKTIALDAPSQIITIINGILTNITYLKKWGSRSIVSDHNYTN